jgi:hypothetical protein
MQNLLEIIFFERKLKRDHHSLCDGLANVFKRTSRRWCVMRTNGMTTAYPAGKQAATPQTP